MEYPCDCLDMKYVINNTNLIKKEDGHWIFTWIDGLDKTSKGTNIERFGMKFEYCPWCNKKIEG